MAGSRKASPTKFWCHLPSVKSQRDLRGPLACEQLYVCLERCLDPKIRVCSARDLGIPGSRVWPDPGHTLVAWISGTRLDPGMRRR